MARRQFAAHAQPALHARRAAGRAGRRLSGRGVLAGPAQGHRRPDRRAAGAPGDPRTRRTAATGCAGTACTSSRRCRARCTCRAPTRSSWAAARRWSTPITAAPKTLGVQVRYDTPVDAPRTATTAASSPRTSAASASRPRPACSPAGGFESNREWLREAWGQNERGEWPADNFLIRGTRFNQGVLLKCHDRRRRRHRSATRRRRIAWRSTRARRCTTAASARASTACRSASWSTATRSASTTRARTSGPSATRSGAGWSRSSRARSRYSIIDAKAVGRFMPPVFPGAQADTLPELAAQARARPEQRFMRDAGRLQRRLPARHVRSHGARRLPHRGPDARRRRTGRGRSTRRRSTAIALRPGITFTYLGLKIDEHARRALRRRPSDNLFVAGEMMAGNVLGKGYTAGVGMSIGTAFGRIAGTQRAPRAAPCRRRSACSRLTPLAARRRGAGRRRAAAGARGRGRARCCRSATPAATAKASARCSRR